MVAVLLPLRLLATKRRARRNNAEAAPAAPTQPPPPPPPSLHPIIMVQINYGMLLNHYLHDSAVYQSSLHGMERISNIRPIYGLLSLHSYNKETKDVSCA